MKELPCTVSYPDYTFGYSWYYSVTKVNIQMEELDVIWSFSVSCFRQQIENWSKADWPLHRVFIFCRNCNAFNHICFPCWRTISANVNLKVQKLVFLAQKQGFFLQKLHLITFVPALNHFCRRQFAQAVDLIVTKTSFEGSNRMYERLFALNGRGKRKLLQDAYSKKVPFSCL